MRNLVALTAFVTLVIVASSAIAQPVTGSFIAGQLDGDGFPGTNNAPIVNMTSVSGSTNGSTGGGIGDGTATAQIIAGATGFELRITGSASHSDSSNGYTSIYTSVFPVVRINRSASFTTVNTSTLGALSVQPVVFEAVAGTGAAITGNPNSGGTLAAGDYRIRFAVLAGNTSSFPFFNSSYDGYAGVTAGYYSLGSMNWRMTLVPQEAPGACCRGSTCITVVSSQCLGVFRGTGVACNAAGNNVTPCCKADYNLSGSVTVQDVFDFLTGWFGGDARADFNGGGLSVQDVFDFVAAWFARC